MKKENCSTKTGNVNFFSKNWFVNLSEYIWIFSDFFLIFENPVYRSIFELYLRIVLIDYPETSWVWCVIFLRKRIQISWLDGFFNKKIENQKKSEKNHLYSDELTNQF